MELRTAEAGTSAARPSGCEPIPMAWVDRLFARLAALYGKAWLEQWSGVPMGDVKAAWTEALAGCRGEQIRMALDHVSRHNKWPPSAPEFAAICRQFRADPAHRMMLPAPPLTEMPLHIAEAMAAHKAADGDKPKRDGRDWARQILADDTGKAYPYISYVMAREALGISA